MNKGLNDGFILVKTAQESTLVFLTDIIIIERRLRKIFLVTTERLISYYEKIIYIEPLLGDNFLEVLDGFFINLERTISAKDGILRFDNGYEVQLSRRSFVKAKQNHYVYHRIKQLRNIARKKGVDV